MSWQIVPTVLVEMLQDKDPDRSQSVTKAMMQMTKLDIRTLTEAYEKDHRSTASVRRRLHQEKFALSEQVQSRRKS